MRLLDELQMRKAHSKAVQNSSTIEVASMSNMEEQGCRNEKGFEKMSDAALALRSPRKLPQNFLQGMSLTS